MKKNNIFSLLLIVFLFVGVFVTLSIKPVVISFITNDSGWDSSYGSSSSGSSSSRGSSSSGSSSHRSGSHSSSSSRGSSTSEYGFFSSFFSFMQSVRLMFGLVLIGYAYNKKKNPNTSLDSRVIDSNHLDVTEEEIKAILPHLTLQDLKDMTYKKFVDIQMAWMEFDYDKLKTLCTDELFNTYKSQLNVLKAKNGKNIMKDFTLEVNKVISIKEESNNISLTVFMKISFYDYVIDTKTNKVTRGTDKRKITNNYIMTFVSANNKTNNMYCPNCGAKIKDYSSQNCEYCRATIVKVTNDFILSQKRIVN